MVELIKLLGMKKILLFLITSVCCILFYSCSKDDKVDEGSIEGTWQVVSVSTEDYFSAWDYTFILGSDGSMVLKHNPSSSELRGHYVYQNHRLAFYDGVSGSLQGQDKLAYMILGVKNLKTTECDFVVESCLSSSQSPLPTLHVVKK